MMDEMTRGYDDDQLKQVEFLHNAAMHYYNHQQQQGDNLYRKITFIFGFMATLLTLYGTYATNTNLIFRAAALIMFGLSFLALGLSFRVRRYPKLRLLSNEVSDSTYFDKLYKDTVNLEKVCQEYKEPLEHIETWVTRSIWLFIVGLACMVVSFIVR